MSNTLNPEERARVAAQVDQFVKILAERYDLSPGDVVEAVRWVHAHKESLARLKQASSISVLGVVIGAVLLSLWEGVKTFVRAAR